MVRETHSPMHASQPRPDHAYTRPLNTLMTNNAIGPTKSFDEGEQLLLNQNLSPHTHFWSVPPLPPLPLLSLSEPAALTLPDPGPPQVKTQFSKDMPDCPLQPGRIQATSAKVLSWVLVSPRLDCLRVFLYFFFLI